MERNLPDVQGEYPANPSVLAYVRDGKEADNALTSLSGHIYGDS